MFWCSGNSAFLINHRENDGQESVEAHEDEGVDGDVGGHVDQVLDGLWRTSLLHSFAFLFCFFCKSTWHQTSPKGHRSSE